MLQYDPRNVSVVVGGFQITGFSEDSMITVEKNEDRFSKYVGAAGEVTRTRSADDTGKVTLKLAHTSPSNAILHALHSTDENTGLGTLAVAVIDSNGLSLHSCSQGWIVKEPNADYNAKVSEREWVIEMADLDTRNLGNLVI